MTNEEAFLKFRKNLIDAILADPDYKTVKAFGKFENFIKSSESYRVSDDRFTQFGTPYTPSLDDGRGKNKTNSGGLREAIYEWLELKKYGIDYKERIEQVGFQVEMINYSDNFSEEMIIRYGLLKNDLIPIAKKII